MLVSVVHWDVLPAPGQPPSAIDAVGATPGLPARFTKPNVYNAVEFCLPSVGGAGGPGDYALYKYWYDSKTWKPEGPRGSTPTSIAVTLPDAVPVRVSVEEIETQLAVVWTGGGVVITPEIAEVLTQRR